MSMQSDVYGERYDSCVSEMQLLKLAIEARHDIGFESEEEAAQWAKEQLLDLIVLSRSNRQFYYLTYRGDILTKRAWLDAYCDVLFINNVDKNGKATRYAWLPKGMKYHDEARVIGEQPDRDRLPIYHRDYFTPSGYFDRALGTFNVAKPFPAFAKITNRDTSHIYRYIEAIAGECYVHLLAWLRMKMCHPTQKTQVVPIIVSRAQGTGKTTFAEVICKGLFGKDNVLVTDQYDSNSRFNADYADALIVCHEEKEYEDKRNSAASLKSRSTATTIRKENKGQDPIYQESYTDFIVTSNKDVPIKFDDDSDQRRFMIMEADEDFTRKKSSLADEVFTKLYGRDKNNNSTNTPFVDDVELQQQFKHELFSREDIKNTDVRMFPHTPAYDRCFTLPRTSEATEIEAVLRTLAPFIRASLDARSIITEVIIPDTNEMIKLSSYLFTIAAMQYFPAAMNQPEYVALCRPLVFYDQQTQKPYSHATVERTIYDCESWLTKEFGIRIYPVTLPIPGGFFGVQGRYRSAPTARFILESSMPTRKQELMTQIVETVDTITEQRIGERLRVNGRWQPDAGGEFETLNEMKAGVRDLRNKSKNVQYMDTFLFESDETSKHIYMIEEERLNKEKNSSGVLAELTAEKLFQERLRLQRSEAERLFKQGIAARIVYSGGKSYHIIVRVADEPETLEQYKWLHAHLSLELSDKIVFDGSTADPARLTRAPIMHERKFEYHGVKIVGQQKPMHTNWNAVYMYNWRPLYQQWLNRPLSDIESMKNTRLMPTKKEYRKAMSALLHGTFWTDPAWNGRRQQCFFPGYRLCRLLGYSHDQLWCDEGILDGLDNYYRRNEIEYWRSRKESQIIAQIDKNISEMEESCM